MASILKFSLLKGNKSEKSYEIFYIRLNLSKIFVLKIFGILKIFEILYIFPYEKEIFQ